MSKRLFVFSVDAMVTEDVNALRQMPNFQKYLAGGSEFKDGMRTIYPSVTYPAHVSILTGCYAGKHGITSNFDFTTTNKDDNWLWFSDRIQVEDIFSVAKKAGLKTASVSWPVTGCNPNVDYLIDEYWMPLPGDTLASSFRRAGSSDEVIRIMERPTDLLGEGWELGGKKHFMQWPQVDRWIVATPVPAPALIPRMCGSARGFMNTACMTDPDMASPMPARIAVRSLGSRKLLTIAAIRLSAVPVNA